MSFFLRSRNLLLKPSFRVSGHAHLRLMSSTPYEFLLTAKPAPGVALVTLNRPKALNALSSPLFVEINAAMNEFDNDDDVKAIVLTGSEKAFAGKQ